MEDIALPLAAMLHDQRANDDWTSSCRIVNRTRQGPTGCSEHDITACLDDDNETSP